MAMKASLVPFQPDYSGAGGVAPFHDLTPTEGGPPDMHGPNGETIRRENI